MLYDPLKTAGYKTYIGKDATTVINPDTGARETTWRTGKRTRGKYQKPPKGTK